MRYRVRKTTNTVFTLTCLAATGLVLWVLGGLLWTLFSNGLPALFTLSFYTQATPAPGMPGGLGNAILGTLLLTVIGIAVATPLGLLIAIYLSEFSRGKRISKGVRFMNDVLLSAPSIVIGLFCYVLLVRPLEHFSTLAGAIALAFIALPIIVRTAEDMLEIVPPALREAALALGAPYWKVLVRILIKSVYQGIYTGILLAIARVLGETAPLLFTSLNNQFWSAALTKPIASLPIVIFEYAMSPYPDWQRLAWGGALLITLVICGLSVLSKFLLSNESEK